MDPAHRCASLPRYLEQTERIMAQSVSALLQFPRHHLPSPEVEASQINCVSKVTGQLRFTPELLP